MSKETRFSKYKRWIENNPFLGIVLALAFIIPPAITVIQSGQSLLELFLGSSNDEIPYNNPNPSPSNPKSPKPYPNPITKQISSIEKVEELANVGCIFFNSGSIIAIPIDDLSPGVIAGYRNYWSRQNLTNVFAIQITGFAMHEMTKEYGLAFAESRAYAAKAMISFLAEPHIKGAKHISTLSMGPTKGVISIDGWECGAKVRVIDAKVRVIGT